MSILIKPRKKISDEQMQKAIEKDHKMVKGIFRFLEVPGGSLSFSFHKYKGDSVLNYTMVDGKTYEVPRMVATHLNKNCGYERHGHVMDINGNPIVDRSKTVKRCSFESLEFMDDE